MNKMERQPIEWENICQPYTDGPQLTIVPAIRIFLFLCVDTKVIHIQYKLHCELCSSVGYALHYYTVS